MTRNYCYYVIFNGNWLTERICVFAPSKQKALERLEKVCTVEHIAAIWRIATREYWNYKYPNIPYIPADCDTVRY
jgi:hypothetical protein